jgi:heme exporter protein D
MEKSWWLAVGAPVLVLIIRWVANQIARCRKAHLTLREIRLEQRITRLYEQQAHLEAQHKEDN